MPNRYKSPSKKLNFFQNYKAHIDTLIHKHYTIALNPDRAMERITSSRSFDEAILGLINDKLEPIINFTTPLYDAYDYMDEVVGAVPLPLLALAASVYCIARTVENLFYLAASRLDCREQDENKEQGNHWTKAFLYTLGAVAAVLAAILSFIKCTISMVTRPIATLVKGFSTGNEIRFGVPPENYDSSADNSADDELEMDELAHKAM